MTSQRIEQVIADDGVFDVHIWVPDGGEGPAILLLQEIFGVGPYIHAVAERLASTGYVVGAPDLFWRFARNWVADHDETGLAGSIEQVGKLDPQLAVSDSVATIEHLAALPEVHGRPAVLGFCLGGTLAFGVAAADDPSCCISYYGSGVPGMLDLLDNITCPTLLHFGDSDAYIPNDGVEALVGAIQGRSGFSVNIERAGHAFDNHEAAMFYDESAAKAAWAKTLAFLGTHLPVG